ncbi:tyrosine-type recombinase/integrase [Microbulbifer aggregans]|uniref:tyrosine-type recombinase/integrase n=1 Tax=Microbulbifer aggregans TaxID=1769779 RepID=UPI001CFD333C|nr:site-specific integrase [Microbulbifer aggregans]
MSDLPSYTVAVPSSTTFGVINRIEVNWNHLVKRREFVLREMEDKDFNYLVLPEVERLLSVIDDGTTHLAAYTLWVTGARVSELLTLRPMDFSLEQGDSFVSMPTLKNRTPKRARPPRRILTLADPAYLETLRRYIKTQRIQKKDPIFDLSRSAVRHRLNAAGKRVAPPLPLVINPHTLRHSFAINHLIHGKNLEQVQRLLGHSDKRSTEIYLRVLDADMSHHSAGTPFRMPLEVEP